MYNENNDIKVRYMKSKVIVIKKKRYLSVFFITIIFMSILYLHKPSEDIDKSNYMQIENNVTVCTSNQTKEIEKINKEEKVEIKNKLEVQEIEGVKVIGKLEIPKINLNTYILEETSKETLNKSVTKLCGPQINGVGNLCITGHNYHNDKMFGNLKDIEINDKIYITGERGDKVEYVVYEIDKVYPKNVECLSQDTESERQITLITCTTGAIKRLIVKATEVYD